MSNNKLTSKTTMNKTENSNVLKKKYEIEDWEDEHLV